MPWYKCVAYHGPGHQSCSVRYEWFETRLGRSQRKALFDEMFENKDRAIGEMREVKRLPQTERERKIADFRGQVSYALKMLALLGA